MASPATNVKLGVHEFAAEPGDASRADCCPKQTTTDAQDAVEEVAKDGEPRGNG